MFSGLKIKIKVTLFNSSMIYNNITTYIFINLKELINRSKKMIQKKQRTKMLNVHIVLK